jgi:hypothetical protein
MVVETLLEQPRAVTVVLEAALAFVLTQPMAEQVILQALLRLKETTGEIILLLPLMVLAVAAAHLRSVQTAQQLHLEMAATEQHQQFQVHL